MGRWQVNATEAIATLPRDAARMLAVEILLAWGGGEGRKVDAIAPGALATAVTGVA